MTVTLRFRLYCFSLIAICFLMVFPASTSRYLAAQQTGPKKLDAVNLERAHVILKQTHDELKKNYYDPTFHGIDIEGTYHQYDNRLNASTTPSDTFRVIAAYLLQLKDSHTFFQPPTRTNHSTLGFDLAMVGDRCFITHIRPKTDAEKKLHVGDQVLAINGYGVQRAELWNMEYFFNDLTPAPAEMLELQDPSGTRRKETIQAMITPGKSVLDLTDEGNADFWQLVRADENSDHVDRQRYVENGDVLVWKMPSFMGDTGSIDTMFAKARKHETLVLDLRDNPGGSIDTLKSVVGHLFDHDVKIADRVSRKDNRPMIAKTQGKGAFTGKLIVLVNSGSASCSELLARVVQLEKRGTVIGDKSAGAVMEATDITEQVGTDYIVLYGLSITAANLVMTDGKSLEKVGVTPDELLLPSAQDITDGKDPVLSHALQTAGLNIDPTAAGKLFAFEWREL